jgi:hypothetical protein
MSDRMVVIAIAVVIMVLLMKTPAFATKPGALLSTRPEMDYARRILARIWTAHGYQLTVTSGLDSTHSAESLHYEGLAEDYRTRDVAPSQLSGMVSEARAILGRDYDVVLESDHLHVEYDPK